MNPYNHPHPISGPLDTEQRCFIINARNRGLTYAATKDDFYEEYGRVIYDSTISDLMHKAEETGSVRDLPHAGRSRIYDDREERIVVRYASNHPFDSLRDLESSHDANPKGASKDTLSRIYEKHDLVSRVMTERLASMSKTQVKARREFAKTHLEWNVED